MPVKRAKKFKAKCDVLFSRIIRSRSHCERCKRSGGVQLQTAHIISRRYAATRTDERNALCLCASCHFYFTANPVEFGAFVQERLGKTYQDLKAKAERVTKMDWEAEYQRLQELAKKVGL